MKLTQEVRQIGTANPVSGSAVGVQAYPSGTAVTTGVSDAEGLAPMSAQGTPGNVRVRSERQGSTYDVYSATVQSAGRYDLETHRARLKVLLNPGVVPAYGNVFALLSTGSGQITIDSGAVVIDGILATFPLSTQLAVADGDRALVAVLSTDAVSLTEIAYSAINSAIHVPIYRYTVASGNVIASSVTWVALFAGRVRGRAIKLGQARAASGTAISGVGDLSSLVVALTLENGVTYNVDAQASVISRDRSGVIFIDINGNPGAASNSSGDRRVTLTNSHSLSVVGTGAAIGVAMYHYYDTALTDWSLQGTYGPTINGLAMSGPGQVATDASGNVYVADTGNNRVVKLNSSGSYVAQITGLTGVTGVCVDASGNVYLVRSAGFLRKYNSSLVQQWGGTEPLIGGSSKHVATDGTYLYVTGAGNTVTKFACVDGSFVANWGSTGSGNGQFSTPWGIAYNSITGLLYVVDSGNARVQVFNTAGTYQRQWPTSLNTRGIAVDSNGWLFVAEPGPDYVVRYTSLGPVVDFFSFTDGDGVAVASGDVVWVSSSSNHTVAKWDETQAFPWDAGLLVARAIPRS